MKAWNWAKKAWSAWLPTCVPIPPALRRRRLQEVREYVGKEYGAAYLPETPNTFKEKKDAQGAHEAIRPTSAMRHPDQVKQYLKEDEFKVYKLIWQRFVASQINPAVFDQTTVDIDAKSKNGDVFWFRVTGSVMKFDGFLRVYEESKEGKDEEDEEFKHKLPALEAGQKLTLKELKPEQHFTEPPPRYNEASLVKELEERGIGRPSTYSAILSTIQERQYVQKIGGKFTPTEIGLVVTDLLVENFRDIFDMPIRRAWKKNSTRSKKARRSGLTLLPSSTRNSTKDLKYAEKHMENIKRMEKPTDEKCERCGAPLVIKWGKHGSFYACSTYDKENQGIRAPSPKKIPSTCPISIRPTCRRQTRGILRELRPGDGAEARTLRAVHGLHGISLIAKPPGGSIRARSVPDIPLDELLPQVRAQHDDPARALWRVHHVQRISRMQVCEAEFIGVKCPECKDGDLVEKRARKGNTFYGCGNYPEVQIHFGP
jgi:DNA topoisomerase-1